MEQIYAAKTNSILADALIEQYMGFIRSQVIKCTGRILIADGEDTLSIAMFAFYEAMMRYERIRGNFIAYAATCIRSRLIDYNRREQRHQGQASLDAPMTNDGDDERSLLNRLDCGEDNVELEQQRSMTQQEIVEFGEQLGRFGVQFSAVAENCPQQERTFAACQQVLGYARSHPALLDELVRTKKLPMTALCEGTGVPRKTLERHRNYLVAVLLAFTNGYELIRGHLCQTKLVRGGAAR